ncbi:MAG: cytidine deaminase [Chthonomonadaceae bacterium]|nr:cytidine deaminase [Chthonomonadaceae bacterium]
METKDLIQRARGAVGEFPLSKEWLTAGSVSSALVTESGSVYTGICLDLACGIGFCAEHSAVAAMLLHREMVVVKIVALSAERIIPPCGRCRDLLMQVDRRNLDCEVILSDTETKTLRELLPHAWIE